jgi:hypothetical protein
LVEFLGKLLEERHHGSNGKLMETREVRDGKECWGEGVSVQ